MRTRIVSTLEDLQSLRADWQAMEQPERVPMHQFIWIEACAAAFSTPETLRVLAIEDGGRLVAAAPLRFQPSDATLRFLGAEELGEPTDIVYAGDPALQALSDA